MCFKISILLFTTKAAKQVKWGITVIYGSMNVSEITLKNKKLYKRFNNHLSLIRFHANLFLLRFVCNLFFSPPLKHLTSVGFDSSSQTAEDFLSYILEISS